MSLLLPDLAQDQFYDPDMFYQSEYAQPTYDWSLPVEQTVAPTDIFTTKQEPKQTTSEDDEDSKDMSSKERRQIRNKISARNFRMRRKEYIVNLEAEIKKYKSENKAVRQELMESRMENARILTLVDRLRDGLEKVALVDKTVPRWGPPESPFKLDACARKERLDALLKQFSTDQKFDAHLTFRKTTSSSSSSSGSIPSRLATGSPVKQEDSSFTLSQQRVKVHSVRVPELSPQIFQDMKIEKMGKDLGILQSQLAKQGFECSDVLVKIMFVVTQCFPKVEYRMGKESK